MSFRRRAGLYLMLLGLLLGGGATLLTVRLLGQAAEASRSGMRQVEVVTTTRDVADQTLITPDLLTIKRFPAEFAPAGAVFATDQVVNKFANGFIAKDQVVVTRQVAPARRSVNLTDRVPPGRVVIWLPMPDLLAQANALKPGDRVDILLTMPLGGGERGGGTSTQTTLQNVEVFRLGQEEVNLASADEASPRVQPGPATNNGQAQVSSTPTPQPAARATASRPVGFLVDHQDAVIIKFIKDSGGTIDLAIRSVDEQQTVRTDAVTVDSLVDRFRFRIPQPVVR